MSDEKEKPKSDADAQLEREIRAERKFTVEEAIGRLIGPGMMKGASPVTKKQQAVVEIGEYLRQHLADSAGTLSGVLLRQVEGCELILRTPDEPMAVLAGYVGQMLGSEEGLRELVREADVEWGRVFGERPQFEKQGTAPAADDPYTLESVRRSLTQLADGLGAGQ